MKRQKSTQHSTDKSVKGHELPSVPTPAQFLTSAARSRGADAPSFRGTFQHSMDEKCRISVPSTFRDTLRRRGIESLVVTNFITDGVRCLEAYPLADWHEFEQKLASQSRFDERIRKLETYYLARASECALDSSGRILLPQNLCSYAGLSRDVVFSATLHGFRIWDSKVWELVFQQAEAALLEDPSLFNDLDTQT